MKRSLKNKQGFTLIELIIVIVILGILSAVAIPKFANLQSDAKIAAVKGIAGALGGAAVTTHARWLISPPASGTDYVTIEGKQVKIYYNGGSPGYPTEKADGILKAITYSADKFTFDEGSNDVDTDNASFQYNSKTDCAAYYGVDNNTYNVYTDVAGCD